MREIKFRAWDTANKLMHDRFQFIQSGDAADDWILFTSTQQRNLWEQPDKITLDGPYSRIQFEIMQFVERQDKNGRDCYEGDIYAYDFEYDSDYDGDMPIVKRANGIRVIKTIHDLSHLNWIKSESGKFEIVGNIYQNPELVKL